MSASDAAPLPRLGEVFFDVRGDSRTMRLSWYADTGVAVFSIWQGGTCTGTFRLPIGDLPRMVAALERGPGGEAENADPAAGPDDATGLLTPGRPRDLRPAAAPEPPGEIRTGEWDVLGESVPPGEVPGTGGFPPGPGTGGFPPGPRSGGFPAGPGSGGYPADPGSSGLPAGPRSGGFPAGRGAPEVPGYLPEPGSGGHPARSLPPAPGERPGGYPPEPAGDDGRGAGRDRAPGPEPTRYLPGPGSGDFPARTRRGHRRGGDADRQDYPPEGRDGEYGPAARGTGVSADPGARRRDAGTRPRDPAGQPDGYLPDPASGDFPARTAPRGRRAARRSDGYVPAPPGYRPELDDTGPPAGYAQPADHYAESSDGYAESSAGYAGPPAARREPAGGYPEPAAGYADPAADYGGGRRRGGHRAGPQPDAGATSLMPPHQPDGRGAGYAGGPAADFPPGGAQNYADGQHYQGDSPIPGQDRVSPARPYVEPEGDAGGGEWADRPHRAYDGEPASESFPYDQAPDNRQASHGNRGRH